MKTAIVLLLHKTPNVAFKFLHGFIFSVRRDKRTTCCSFSTGAVDFILCIKQGAVSIPTCMMLYYTCITQRMIKYKV